ncbi:aquaporin [Rhizodiscina lignyota]|uniref:Aquaporin n=1 Tax=Rhizodiscina lignyota TaxID=1504668 RepID=A0A9P4I8U3_9PEZI|nr:aquaporin [Rhizodiscina lignyota]
MGMPESPSPNRPLAWSRVRSTAQDAFSEFFGVFIFLLFSLASIAQVVLSNGQKGTYTSIVLGWGVGITLGAYVAGKSGAHLNPGVTLSMCVYRRLPWSKFPVYAVAQTAGAFAAAAVVYGNYIKAIDAYEGGPGIRTVPGFSTNATAGIFATYPADVVAGSKTAQFFSEFIPSSILMFMIFALTDEGNIAAGKLTPLGLGLTFVGITACFGWETAFALNFARDFGPRLLTAAVGYGSEVWTADGHYFWVPMIAPFLGCLFGGFLYDVFVYEGDSPINTPWMGLKRLVRPGRGREDPEPGLLRLPSRRQDS